MKHEHSILKTGVQFTAMDKLNRKYHYEVVGIDLQDYISGTGCAYIVLNNLDTNTHTCVEMAWFKEREITEINPIRNSIEVPCTAGTLCAETGGDPDYPEVFTYLRREDGVDIDICAVEGDAVIPDEMNPEDFKGQKDCNGGLKAVLYADTCRDDWTEAHSFTKEELMIEG